MRVAAASTPTLSIDNVSTAEGNAGATTLSVPVTLSAAATRTVIVRYTTADGTAKALTGTISTGEEVNY